jgi:hypothetical protein
MVKFNCQPRIVERIMAGANMVRPAAKPLEMRNNMAVNVLVAKLKRPSRYS